MESKTEEFFCSWRHCRCRSLLISLFLETHSSSLQFKLQHSTAEQAALKKMLSATYRE